MRRFGSTMSIGVALVLGLLASVLSWQYLQHGARAAAPAMTAPVVVAAVPIAARTALTAEMLRVQELSVDALHPQAVRSPHEVVGKVTRMALTRASTS